MKYKIVRGFIFPDNPRGLEQFEKDVQKHISKGYRPLDGPRVIPETEHEYVQVLQALVYVNKREKQ